MQRDEIWSISITRISAFFDAQPDLIKTSTGYRSSDCQITLRALTPNNAVRISIPRTQVIFEGSDASVAAIYHRFLIQFLTAGG